MVFKESLIVLDDFKARLSVNRARTLAFFPGDDRDRAWRFPSDFVERLVENANTKDPCDLSASPVSHETRVVQSYADVNRPKESARRQRCDPSRDVKVPVD